MSLKLNDNVQFIVSGRGPINLVGRIAHIRSKGIKHLGVVFSGWQDGHNLDGKCEAGKGWWCKEEELKLVESNEVKDFNVGNRVRFTDNTEGPTNLMGQIMIIKSDGLHVGVCFDKSFSGGHTLDSYHNCENKHGWWCSESQLELINEDESRIEDKPFGLQSKTESKIKKMLQTIPKNLKRILSKDLRKQYKAGVVDSNLELTSKGTQEMLDILSQDKVVQAGLTKFADKEIREEKKNRKDSDD